MLADHEQQQRKQMSIPARSWDIPDTHPHLKADAGEWSRSFSTTNNMCHNEGLSIPLFSFPDVSGHRKAWLIICFINVLQYLPYPTTADRRIINCNAETGWNSQQECWGVSEGWVTTAIPELSIVETLCRMFGPITSLLYLRSWFHCSLALHMLWKFRKRFHWSQPFIRAPGSNTQM